MRLYRAHGLGNDYLVVEQGPALTEQLVRALCDRHRGVGGDGVLEPRSAPGSRHGVRIWNPDGSVAEKSGNGLRIYAWWLVTEQGAPRQLELWTGFETALCEVGTTEVAVSMGRARFQPDEVPVDRWRIDSPLKVGSDVVRVVALGLGNPHCVCFVDRDPDSLPWRRWGAALEVNPIFPNRTNVQVAQVVDRCTVQARIWERGAGETLASGSSACAVAAAGVRTERLDAGTIRVVMPGGTLRVQASSDLDLVLSGPVEPVARVEVDRAWLAARS